MKKLILIALIALFAIPATAPAKTQKMDVDLMEFIEQTLHSSKPGPNLLCEIKVRTIRQERKFSDGVKWIEMIEVQYRQDRNNSTTEMKTYFPMGSVVKRKNVNSEFSGPVEEIEISAGDRLSKTLTFQHDGRGQIVWMMMADELRNCPCQLRRR